MKAIAYIAAAILIFFGVLFVWGAFSSEGSPGWILVGLISISAGFVIIWFFSRAKKSESGSNITYQVDLPANISLDTLKCKSCGGAFDR